MKKYLINDDDVITVGQNLYRIDPENSAECKEFPFLRCEKASKNYNHRLIQDGADGEILSGGNDKNATPIMQGDIIASNLDDDLAFILISDMLIPLYEAKRALEAYSTATNRTVISLPTPSPTPELEEEFTKRDKKMTAEIATMKDLIEHAENEGVEIIDGVTYSASHTWVEIAKMALDLAEQQEWFERYEDKYCND